MADLSQTAGNVKLKSNGPIFVGIAGETLTQGQPAYLSGNKWFRCDANDTEAKAAVKTIVITPAGSDGYFIGALPGCKVDLGATLTVAETYIVSVNVGAIAPIGDLASSSYATILGVAETTSTLKFTPIVSGVQKP